MGLSILQGVHHLLHCHILRAVPKWCSDTTHRQRKVVLIRVGGLGLYVRSGEEIQAVHMVPSLHQRLRHGCQRLCVASTRMVIFEPVPCVTGLAR